MTDGLSRDLRLEAAWTDQTTAVEHYEAQRLPAAEHVLRRALKNVRGLSPGDDRNECLVRCLGNLAGVLVERARWDEAEQLVREALELCGDEPEPWLVRKLGQVLHEQDRLEEARECYLAALELAEDPDQRARALCALGDLSYEREENQEALEYARAGLRLVDRQSWEGATLVGNLGVYLAALGRFEEAEPLYWESLVLDRAIKGEQHPEVATGLMNLANFLSNDRFEPWRALPLFEEGLNLRVQLFGDDHPKVLGARCNHAALLNELGRFREARDLLKGVLSKVTGRLRGRVLKNLADCHYELADYRAAHQALAAARQCGSADFSLRHNEIFGLCSLNLAETALPLAEALVSESRGQARDQISALNALAEALERLGRDAGPVREQRRALIRDYFGSDHVMYRAARVGRDLADWRRLLALRRQQAGPDNPRHHWIMDGLAAALIRDQRLEEAESVLRECLGLVEPAVGPFHPDLAVTRQLLARVLERLDCLGPAQAELEHALEIAVYDHPANPRSIRRCLRSLADFHLRRGQPDRALAYLARANGGPSPGRG